MTDSSSMLQNQTAVTSDCLFNLKPSASRCKSYRASLPPINASSFLPGVQMIFMIPGGRRNTYLDTTQSYLKFTIVNLDTTIGNTMTLDRSGACFINRLDVFGNDGSLLLETIQNYNVLYSYLLDFQMNVASSFGLSSMLGTGTTATNDLTDRTGNSIPGTNGRLTVCIPIISGVVGTLADKCLPLGKLSSDIRLEFTLETMLNSVSYLNTGTATWQIVSAEIEAQIIELSDEAQSMVNSTIAPESPIYLHGSSFRSYIGNISAAGQFSILISARFASLKTLIVLPRRSTEISGANNQVSYSLSSRVNPNIASYWFRIGSSIVPQKAVDLYNTNTTGGYAQAFAEVMKSWHGLNHCEYGTILSYPEYNVAETAIALDQVTAGATAANSYTNGFAIAQELESFAQRSDVLISGLNTNSSTVFFEGNVITGPTAPYTLNMFAAYDHILVIDPNGLISIKY